MFITFLTYRNLVLIWHMSRFLKTICGTTRKQAMISYQLYGGIRVKNNYAQKYSDSTYLQIKTQQWVGERQL